jgi:hypothetical protein
MDEARASAEHVAGAFCNLEEDPLPAWSDDAFLARIVLLLDELRELSENLLAPVDVRFTKPGSTDGPG